jgi:hypothetical protein
MVMQMRFHSIIALLYPLSSIFAQENAPQTDQSNSYRPLFIDIRHTEHRGIGYQNGYTTFETFFIPSDEVYGCYPYFDFRAHVFNDGKTAFNAGIGARFANDRIWGVNTYYDYRSTRKKKFNQIAAGIESMGLRWDFFANGYLVVGGKKSPYYDARFSHFVNNDAYLKERVDYAMSGLDGKVRYHFLKKEGWDLYFDIGPYFYFNKKNAIGGQAKLAAQIADYIYLEANTSYDHMFKWIGQGIVGITIPLGKKECAPATPNRNCRETVVMRNRLTQIPATQEIIVVDRRLHFMPAINPLTGQPYHFKFLNNLYGSSGTYQDPYGTLAEAAAGSSEYDIIYVYPGDGTSRNMDTGIALKNYQQLLGSGTEQVLMTQVGEMKIPSQTSSMPIITHTTNPASGVNAVTLANHNTVSGIYIYGSNLHGIIGTAISDATIRNNRIEHYSTSNVRGSGIYLTGALSGSFLMNGNTILQVSPSYEGNGIYIETGVKGGATTDVCTINIWGNNLTTDREVIDIYTYADTTTYLEIRSNTVLGTGVKYGIHLEPSNQSRLYYTVTNNSSSSYQGAMRIKGADNSYSNGTISHNTFFNSLTGLDFFTDAGTCRMILTANDNKFSNNTPYQFHSYISVGTPSSLQCIRLMSNIAPDTNSNPGFVMWNDSASSWINISSFTRNEGTLFEHGNVSHNPTCD